MDWPGRSVAEGAQRRPSVGQTGLAALPTPGAVLFDLDGTLVDTVGRRIDGWLAAFAEIGVDADAGLVGGLVGADGKRLARDVAAAAGAHLSEDAIAAIDRRAGAIFSELNAVPVPLPGARDLLARPRRRAAGSGHRDLEPGRPGHRLRRRPEACRSGR